MCEGYIEVCRKVNQITTRRRIWPQGVHLLLGVMKEGSPMAVVQYDYGGISKPEYVKFGMSLILNGEVVVFGWCPSIEDVMGQDWELTEEK
jgi:hypothetical protein